MQETQDKTLIELTIKSSKILQLLNNESTESSKR
jgi:hypothetical protein